MFCTVPHAQLEIPSVFDDTNESWWSYVKLPLFMPYFQLVCSPADPDTGDCNQTFIFSDLEQVLTVLNDSSVEVLAVQLVSPGYMNGTKYWQIDVLETVYKGIETQSTEHRQYAYVYVVAGGARYLHSSIAVTESDLVDIDLVCNLAKE